MVRRAVPIRADPEQVGQALDNLIDNAFVYGNGADPAVPGPAQRRASRST